MSGVTDGDQNRAAMIVGSMADVVLGRLLKQDIAAALAEEREKARAPFLALADEMEDEAEEALSRHTPQQLLFAAPILQAQRGAAQAAQGVADRIRLAAGWLL